MPRQGCQRYAGRYRNIPPVYIGVAPGPFFYLRYLYHYRPDRPQPHGLAPGLYRLYARDALGRTVVQATEIGRYCNVSLSYDSLPAGCDQSNGSITLHATGGFPPYRFTLDGNTFQDDSVFSGLAAGNYGFLVRDTAGTEASVRATGTAPAAPVRRLR